MNKKRFNVDITPDEQSATITLDGDPFICISTLNCEEWYDVPAQERRIIQIVQALNGDKPMVHVETQHLWALAIENGAPAEDVTAWSEERLRKYISMRTNKTPEDLLAPKPVFSGSTMHTIISTINVRLEMLRHILNCPVKHATETQIQAWRTEELALEDALKEIS